FDDLATETADPDGGVTRASYGAGEQRAYDMFAACAHDIGLEVTGDVAGNAYYTLPGADRQAPCVIAGSHLDSVPKGGNFDGAAGVVAGMAAVAAMKDAGIVPPQDIAVMAVRSEECSSWFTGTHGGHLGSRAALGLMARSELDTAIHLDSGKTLGAQMRDFGIDPDRIFDDPPALAADRVKAYIELHIEQGPVLEAAGLPVGIVTGIRGNARARGARCLGEYTHSGAVPQDHRHDAVLAAAELVLALETETEARLKAGDDIVFAAGRFFTDPALHALSKVPGEVGFTLDIRSLSQDILDRMAALAEARAADIARRRGVRFELGTISFSRPTVMDETHRRSLHDGCARLSIPAMDIASGGGHDAQEFERCGIPSSMIFVRNANGSHNADEAMDMADFAEGTRLLAWMVADAL
ncbi:MAG: hydantoinase/carbamoylase family amidase, partial [Gammaproteobacteria bacterium]